VFENTLLKRIFELEKGEGQEAGENFIMRSSVICTIHQILLG
jgi:hypothetical protein